MDLQLARLKTTYLIETAKEHLRERTAVSGPIEIVIIVKMKSYLLLI